MELTNRLLRPPRFCIRYLHIFLTFCVFSLFLLFIHQFRPRGLNYVSDASFFVNWRRSGNFFHGGAGRFGIGGGGATEYSTTGVLPILLPHTFSTYKKEKGCTGEKGTSPLILEGLVPEFIPVGRARYDNRRLLKIYDFFRLGRNWGNLVDQYDVCLATQSSLDRIFWLPQILQNWNGPVSLAVHVTNEEEWLVLNLFTQYLEKCFPKFGEQVSIHLAVPAITNPFCFQQETLNEWNKTVNFEQVKKKSLERECNDGAREYMQYLLSTFPVTKKEKLALKEVYPQNHMRNIARKACGTEWTYSVDVDIIPKYGMAESLQEFYESLQTSPTPCIKCAFVIPTFELDETKPFPKSKAELINYYNSGSARQFHGNIFDVGHKATNYGVWTTSNRLEGPVKISHPIVSSYTYLYEPFYVSPDSIPPYDERFLGYGFTRNSQFQEALYAGWTFKVLTPVFGVHLGLQTKSTLLSPKKAGVGRNVRIQQTNANRGLFNKILKEMKLKKQEGLF